MKQIVNKKIKKSSLIIKEIFKSKKIFSIEELKEKMKKFLKNNNYSLKIKDNILELKDNKKNLKVIVVEKNLWDYSSSSYLFIEIEYNLKRKNEVKKIKKLFC